jgi:hypothetical protein
MELIADIQKNFKNLPSELKIHLCTKIFKKLYTKAELLILYIEDEKLRTFINMKDLEMLYNHQKSLVILDDLNLFSSEIPSDKLFKIKRDFQRLVRIGEITIKQIDLYQYDEFSIFLIEFSKFTKFYKLYTIKPDLKINFFEIKKIFIAEISFQEFSIGNKLLDLGNLKFIKDYNFEIIVSFSLKDSEIYYFIELIEQFKILHDPQFILKVKFDIKLKILIEISNNEVKVIGINYEEFKNLTNRLGIEIKNINISLIINIFDFEYNNANNILMQFEQLNIPFDQITTLQISTKFQTSNFFGNFNYNMFKEFRNVKEIFIDCDFLFLNKFFGELKQLRLLEKVEMTASNYKSNYDLIKFPKNVFELTLLDFYCDFNNLIKISKNIKHLKLKMKFCEDCLKKIIDFKNFDISSFLNLELIEIDFSSFGIERIEFKNFQFKFVRKIIFNCHGNIETVYIPDLKLKDAIGLYTNKNLIGKDFIFYRNI